MSHFSEKVFEYDKKKKKGISKKGEECKNIKQKENEFDNDESIEIEDASEDNSEEDDDNPNY